MFWVYSLPYIIYMVGIILGTVFDYKQLRGPTFLAIFTIIQAVQVFCYIFLQPLAIR